MRFPRPSLILLAALGLPLAGCDRLTGEYDQRIYDAEAIGYACRVSLKTPEECMKENEAQSPTSILDGWKAADKDITKGTLDPTMGKGKPRVIPVPPTEGAASGVIPLPNLAAAKEEQKADKAAGKKKENPGTTDKPAH